MPTQKGSPLKFVGFPQYDRKREGIYLIHEILTPEKRIVVSNSNPPNWGQPETH